MLARIRLYSLTVAVALLSSTRLACGTMTQKQIFTATPAAEPSRPLLLFRDDFSDETSGWLEADDTSVRQGYRDGKFFFEIQATDLLAWDNLGRNLKDFVLTVAARQVSGAPENSYGVLVRYVDDTNFYRFDLTGDGRYAVFKLQAGEWITLVDWRESAHVKAQGEVNAIKVVCRGSRMTFYADDQKLVRIEDDSFERGDVGLLASTFDDPDTEVEFDDLEIWQTD